METQLASSLQEAYLQMYDLEEKIEDETPVEKSNRRNQKSGMSSRDRVAKHRLQRGMKKGQCGREAAERQFDEEYKKFPYKKVEDKIHKKEAANPTGRGTKDSISMGKVFRHFKGEVHRTERREHGPAISKAKSSTNKSRGKVMESIDLYDIILSHLLDEGYVDTQEAAEVVMVNMSEEWRESIVEAKKPLPISKMKRKESKLDSELESELPKVLRTPIGSPERLKLINKNRRFGDIHDVRRSISTRGGKRPLGMPEVGRYKPKDED